MRELERIQKLMLLGGDPPNDLRFLIEDVLGELKRRGVTESQTRGVTLAINIAFALGEKNGALKMAVAREED